MAVNDSGYYYLIKRSDCEKKFGSFSSLFSHPSPQKNLNLRFHFASKWGEKSKYLYKNNQNNDSQTLCKDLGLFPCFENLQRIRLNPRLKGGKETLRSWVMSVCMVHIHRMQAGL